MPAIKTPDQIQPANIKGLFWLSEASGTRADSSGNGNTLTDNNTVTAREGFRQARSGYFNSASSEYLSRANGSLVGLGITGSLSSFCRFKVDSFGSAMTILSKGGTAGNGYAVMINSATSISFYINGAATSITVPFTMLAFTWYDLAVVFDSVADTLSFYINGILIKVSTGITATIASNSSSFNIGASEVPNVYFNGNLEWVVVWDVVLTAAEVCSMSSQSDIFCMNTGGEEHLRSSASVNVKLAQGFTVNTAGWYDLAVFNGYRNNSPTGNVYVTIETNSGGAPSGTALATSENLDVSLPHTSAGELAFRFATPVYLSAGFYWAVLQGTYSVSSTVGLRFIRSSGGAGFYNNGGVAYTYNGTSWSAISTDDFNFRLNRIVGTLIVSHFLEGGNDDRQEFFSNNNWERFAQNIKFTTAKQVKTVFFWMTMFGNPSGTFTAKLYTNNAGQPGTLLATSNSYNRNIGFGTGSPSTRANGGYWSFEFSSPVSLAANTEYFLVIEASAGGSGANYHMISMTSGNVYPSTYDVLKYSGGSWSSVALNWDAEFALFEDVQQKTGNFFLVM